MFLLSENSTSIDLLHEDKGAGKQLYIEGIFAQSEVSNGNGRYYTKLVMENAVSKYNKQYVEARRALGELNHPSRPHVDPSEAAIIIESLTWRGNDVIGKAKVLSTPKGLIVKGLLEGGFAMGVSTRGMGSLKEQRGIKYVQKDFMLTAVDCVDNPSGPDCYVDPIMESVQWSQNEQGSWVPDMDKSRSEEFNEELFMERIEDFIKKMQSFSV